ncbi:MAG TPA: hypothetical protein VJX67_25035 [Blastocatellia bacterium]|nr:hypothetical protein [Blastocatellia bacterium]
MKSRLFWMLGVAVVGGALVCFSPAAVAQQTQAGPNVGQQGEFNGEHVDTGAAALDTGPEATAEPAETLKESDLKSAALKVKAPSSGITGKVLPGKSVEDLNVEQILDLQEIAGPDIVEMK